MGVPEREEEKKKQEKEEEEIGRAERKYVSMHPSCFYIPLVLQVLSTFLSEDFSWEMQYTC